MTVGYNNEEKKSEEKRRSTSPPHLACMAGIQRGGRGENEKCEARTLLFSPFHPLIKYANPESYEMSGCQNDPIRIALLRCGSHRVLLFLVFLTYFPRENDRI